MLCLFVVVVVERFCEVISCFLCSLFIDEDDFSSVYNWAKNQNFGGRWMPECSNRYEMFYREYYWSPAYKYYDSEELTKRKICDKGTDCFIVRRHLPVILLR